MFEFQAALLIPIFVILLPAIIVFIVMFFRTKERKEMHETMRKAIETGQTLPDEFVKGLQQSVKTKNEPMNDIRAGIILLAVAGGLMTWDYLGAMDTNGVMTGIAAIPGFIGIALFLLGLIGLMSKKTNQS
jgi:hypothetical protein